MKGKTTMNAGELMTKQAYSCDQSDTLARAAQIMWDHDCGCVPVLDGGRTVVGIVTDRDGFIAAYTRGKPLHEIPVSIAMARKVKTCRPEDSLESAERTMREAQVRRLPVVDANNHLVGILSLNDIARHLQQAGTRPSNGLAGESIASTLAAISAPPPQWRSESRPS
jgi:CBS domain-containing protein